jgi:uncharacterized damage-inducible protein DinB
MRTSSLVHSVVVISLVILGVTPALAQTPAGGSGQPAPTSFLAPARATWDSTRTLVVGLIEAMPEDKWDFKPTPAVRSFREVVVHLIGENYFFFGRVAGENLPNPAQNLKTRDELLKALHESYAYGAKVWGDLTEAKALEMVEGRGGQKVQRWSAVLLAIQDNMNHYGNLVVYLRLNGVVPPRSARQ